MLGRRDTITGGYVFNNRVSEYLLTQGVELDVLSRRTVPAAIRDSVLKTSSYVLRRIVREKPDILIISKSYLYVLPLRIYLAFSRIPLLYLVHHLEWHDRAGEHGSLFRRLTVKWLLHRAQRIWTNSRSTSDDVAALGIAEDRLKTIPPGFDKGEKPVPIRDSGHLPVRLLSVGAITPRKAQDVMVKACSQLGEREYFLDIVGDTEASSAFTVAVESLIRERSLESRIRLHGHVGTGELAEYYRKADILVHPSRWEGYGIAIAEAMWHGLPVVGSNAGALPELVRNNINGLLVPPGNPSILAEKLAMLIDSPDMRKSMGTASRRTAEGLNDWEETSRQFFELVKETASQGRRQ